MLLKSLCKVSLMLQLLQTAQSKVPNGREKRFVPVLIYPPTAPTRVQWIVGIGIPLEDLLYEAMTTGYVFKAEYFLPDTAQKLRTRTQQPITVEWRKLSGDTTKFEKYLTSERDLKRNDTLANLVQQKKRVLSSYRWTIYKALEGLAKRISPTGRACVLKSICEAAETPFHYQNGMFAELLHILLTPSSSADELSEYADNEYFHAETLGRSGADCSRIFKKCKKSLLEQITDVRNLSDDMMQMFG